VKAIKIGKCGDGLFRAQQFAEFVMV